MYTYEQSTGKLYSSISGGLVGTGYAGSGVGKNNPAMQHLHNVGPLPRGMYTIIGPPRDTPLHGKYVLILIPDEGNEMYGRSGFLCHGDSIKEPGTASEGCMVQAHDTRVMMWEGGDHRLQVVDFFVPRKD